MKRATIATLALATAASVTWAQESERPSEMCAYIEFPYRLEQGETNKYFVATGENLRRGRLRGTLDLQGVSAIFDDGLDVNGRSQTLVAFRGLQGDGYMEEYRAHQISCTDSLPRHSGMMCATQRVLQREVIEHTYETLFERDHRLQFAHSWFQKWQQENPWTFRNLCLDDAREHYPGAEYEVMHDDLVETGTRYIQDADGTGPFERLIHQWFSYECSVTVSSYEGASWQLVGLPEDDIPAWVNLDEHRFVGFWGDDIVGYTDNGRVAIIDEVDESECPNY